MKEAMIGHSVNFNTKKLDWNYSGGYITSAVTAYTALLHSFFFFLSLFTLKIYYFSLADVINFYINQLIEVGITCVYQVSSLPLISLNFPINCLLKAIPIIMWRKFILIISKS